MDFLKKHYEKVLLSVVLLALAVVAAALPFTITQTQAELEEKEREPRASPSEYEPVDLSSYEERLGEITSVPGIQVGSGHNVFNPVRWRQGSDGRLYKEHELGPESLELVDIRPLYTRVSYDRVGTGGRYVFRIAMEASPYPSRRRETNYFLRPQERSDNHPFLLREVMGPSDNPEAFVMELTDANERFEITPDEGWQRLEGYAADLRYPPASQSFSDQRQGDTIRLNQETYEIVAITENDITVEAESGKRTTISANSAQ